MTTSLSMLIYGRILKAWCVLVLHSFAFADWSTIDSPLTPSILMVSIVMRGLSFTVDLDSIVLLLEEIMYFKSAYKYVIADRACLEKVSPSTVNHAFAPKNAFGSRQNSLVKYHSMPSPVCSDFSDQPKRSQMHLQTTMVRSQCLSYLGGARVAYSYSLPHHSR